MKKWFALLLVILPLVSCQPNTNETFVVTLIEDQSSRVIVVTSPYLDYPEVPVKEDHAFAGWYLDADFLYPFGFNAPLKQNQTLYAKFVLDEPGFNYEYMLMQLENYLTSSFVLLSQDALKTLIQTEIANYDALNADIDILSRFENQVTQLLNTAQESVVMIDAYKNATLESGGSGVIYKREGSRYYVVTNEHVTNGYTTGSFELTLFIDGQEITIDRSFVTLRKQSVKHDLAVLTFTSSLDLPIMPLGNDDYLKQGQIVFSIGSPLDLPNSVTMGIISATNREQAYDLLDTIAIQHTATINPGNSGGALVNILGELVGINFQSYVDEYVGEGIEGLHFAIQVNILKQILPTLE